MIQRKISEDKEVVEKQNLLKKKKKEVNSVKEKCNNEKLPPLILKGLIKRF